MYDVSDQTDLTTCSSTGKFLALMSDLSKRAHTQRRNGSAFNPYPKLQK